MMKLVIGRLVPFLLILPSLQAFRGTPIQHSSRWIQNAVSNMEVSTLGDILKDDNLRMQYQIIDVREPDELALCSLKYKDVINLPLSAAGDWSEQIKQGRLLDRSKPTLCLCKVGMRSMKVANFLLSQAEFEEVYNVVGGIDKYAEKVDPSVGFY